MKKQNANVLKPWESALDINTESLRKLFLHVNKIEIISLLLKKIKRFERRIEKYHQINRTIIKRRKVAA
jgi:hypothetical protein